MTIMTKNCCAAVRGEFKGPMFDLVEQSASAPTREDETGVYLVDSTPRSLDIVKTFSPHPRVPYIGVKISLAAWIVSAMPMSIISMTYPSFWLAYVTHWGLIVATAYIILSALSAVYLAIRPPSNPDELKGGVGLLIKSTWALFAIALPAEIVITILYWTLEFDADDGVTYINLMVHGIVMVLIMIDGFVLSRIPLRMKQFILFESLTALYFLWTVIHAYSGIGNPYADGDTPTQDDDAIFGSLAWKNNTTASVILFLGVLFAVNPIIFMMCRALSRLLPRRLCEEDTLRAN
jgi:hypothetical protein